MPEVTELAVKPGLEVRLALEPVVLTTDSTTSPVTSQYFTPRNLDVRALELQREGKELHVLSGFQGRW